MVQNSTVVLFQRWIRKHPIFRMANKTFKLKIFDILRNDFATVGIEAQQFNAKNLINIIILKLNMFTVFAHIVCGVHTFNDFVESVYRCLGVVVTATIFISFVQQSSKLFNLIDGIENDVNKSN